MFSNLCYLKWYTKSNYVLLFKVNVYHRPNHPIMTEVLFVGCYVLQCFSFLSRDDKMGGAEIYQNEQVKSILSDIA